MPDSNITKKALAQAMKDLMVREPFAKISVGDICDACGMNRKSFYYHFRDKYDLVNWIFYTEFIQAVQGTDYPTGWDFLSRMCAYFYQERDFYRCAMQIEGQNSFREYFGEIMTPFLTTLARDVSPELDDPQFYITFFVDAFLASLVRWLSEGTPMPPEEYAGRLKRFVLALAHLVLSEDEGGPIHIG